MMEFIKHGPFGDFNFPAIVKKATSWLRDMSSEDDTDSEPEVVIIRKRKRKYIDLTLSSDEDKSCPGPPRKVPFNQLIY